MEEEEGVVGKHSNHSPLGGNLTHSAWNDARGLPSHELVVQDYRRQTGLSHNNEREGKRQRVGGRPLLPPQPHHRRVLPSHVKVDLLRYGLGQARTLAAWYLYAGVDAELQTVDGRWCGKVE